MDVRQPNIGFIDVGIHTVLVVLVRKIVSMYLPKIDAFMMKAYFTSNLDFMYTEIIGVKLHGNMLHDIF